MKNHDRNIALTLVYQQETFQLYVYRNEYYSLMVLISSYLGIDDFGLCCGMGSCGTCIVEIKTKYENVKRLALSCDVQINDELANTSIIIPEHGYT